MQNYSELSPSLKVDLHEQKVDDQVNKLMQRVKQIQQAARSKPTSLTRMQFLNQLEDAYGFHGYKND